MLNSEKIKIAIWLNDDMVPQEGGAYSYLQLLLSLLDNNNFENAELVFITYNEKLNFNFKKKVISLNSQYGFYMKSLKLLRRLFGNYLKLNNYLSIKIDVENDHIIKSMGIDYIYYLNQCQRELKQSNFIATNWDLAHLTLNGYSEFTENGQLEKRNNWYFNQLQLASAIVVESQAGKKELLKYLNLDENKIHVVPFFIKNIEYKIENELVEHFLLTNKLNSKQYLYYPAQFWAHKNHLNLISAFASVVKRKPSIKLVLSGSDKGYLQNIKDHISELEISENVLLLGFVSEYEKHILYNNAMCLVMPTYLGPTNLPPLEALNYDIPVICSNLEGHKEMLGNSAIYFNPDNVSEIANSIETICNLEEQKKYILNGKSIKEHTKFTYEFALNAHENLFTKLYSNKLNGN